jgi:hypothetical protein
MLSNIQPLKGAIRFLLISISMFLFVLALSRCVDNKETVEDPRGPAYTGAASCNTCHKDITASFEANPHAMASAAIKEKSFKVHYPALSNDFHFDEQLQVKVEQRDSGFYQVAYEGGKEIRAARFDVVFGAGVKAATFASWDKEDLKQLPISYFRDAGSWANSPGYPPNHIYFDRAITSRCMECHASFAEKKMANSTSLNRKEQLVKGSLIYGIDCERCHGPGREHVTFHTEHPDEKTAKHITLYQKLNRKQQVDACAVCHAGNDIEAARSTFNFKPGDDLSKYYYEGAASFSSSSPDVHGNQSKLMVKSKCYIISNSMTCNTCHSTHETQPATLAGFSKKCQSCHQDMLHPEVKIANGLLKENCIDCHMPKQSSNVISFQTAGNDKMSAYLLRTHRIAVY